MLGDLCAQPGQPEVEHAGHVVRVHQDVLGLEVAVNQSHAMGRGQALPRREVQLDDLGRAALAPIHPAPRRDPLDQLHRDEEHPVVGPHLVHRRHVGVGELGHRRRFPQQALGAVGHRAVQLDRDVAPQREIAGAIHDAHATRTDDRLDFERVGEHRAGEQPRRGLESIDQGAKRRELGRIRPCLELLSARPGLVALCL